MQHVISTLKLHGTEKEKKTETNTKGITSNTDINLINATMKEKDGLSVLSLGGCFHLNTA